MPAAAGAPPHLLVTQLRFARSEFVRGLEGVSEADGLRRLQPMNSIGWMVGHLANQEHRYWVVWAQRKDVAPLPTRLPFFPTRLTEASLPATRQRPPSA